MTIVGRESTVEADPEERDPSAIIGAVLVVYAAGFLSPAIAVGLCLSRFRRKEQCAATPLVRVLLARKDSPYAETGRILRRGLGIALLVGGLLSGMCTAVLFHADTVGSWLCS